MSTAKERVEDELKELNIKIDKIVAFRTTAIYESLSKPMQQAIRLQEMTMLQYAYILKWRLEMWED